MQGDLLGRDDVRDLGGGGVVGQRDLLRDDVSRRLAQDHVCLLGGVGYMWLFSHVVQVSNVVLFSYVMFFSKVVLFSHVMKVINVMF